MMCHFALIRMLHPIAVQFIVGHRLNQQLSGSQADHSASEAHGATNVTFYDSMTCGSSNSATEF